ncbi:hypothetical protein DACRYDRAFT_106144 [Dacryopinax primogenitus]|uniref:F-box domain-containing protein n=1 Tax=Dacryopinax primogenitus (strain DJM 731) TaxID=1858805 RepID=M5FY25_DACPD|nr:uncharacterized protein DACRYDRAFT_106144 [Dacryopinax primogenitus]EJU02966.1 hypothetical protein DACRYDRAFT_106144 [Dacryopinax primogenitus]
MHRFWSFDDLVVQVLDYLERADQAHVARLRKHLFLLAIPFVWQRPSFKGLANLLVESSAYPTTLFAKVRSLMRSNGKPQANWLGENESTLERLAFYGAYARRLDIVEPGKGHDDDFYAIVNTIFISEYSMEDIFSSLEHIHVTVSTPAFAAQAFRFAVPTLKYLNLTLIVIGLTEDAPGARSSDFLPYLLGLPRLDNLQLYGRATSAEAEAQFLEQTAKHFPAMKKFSAPLMLVDASFFGPLSIMRGLEKINIQLTYIPFFPSPCILPILYQLSVTYTRVKDLQCLLEALSAPLLKALQIKSNAIRITGSVAEGNTRTYRTLCETVANSWPGLQVFTLSGFPDIITSTEPPSPWKWTPFSPLLRCQDMRTCTIQTPVKVDVSDADLYSIADAWPELQHLALAIPEGSIVEPPSATFYGLLYLARKCTKLENVALSMTLIPSGTDELTLPNVVPNTSVLRLDVHDCPPCDAALTATLLTRLFPELKRFRFSTRKVVPNDPELDGADEQRMEAMMEIKARLELRP